MLRIISRILLVILMTGFLDLFVADVPGPISVYFQMMLNNILESFFRELILTDETLDGDERRIVWVFPLYIVAKDTQNLLVYFIDGLNLFADSLSNNDEVVHVICIFVEEHSLSIAFV